MSKLIDKLNELYEASHRGGLLEDWRQEIGKALDLAVNGSTEDATSEILKTLTWLVADANYRREQTGLEGAPLSCEMQLAQKLLEELRAGRITCRRIS